MGERCAQPASISKRRVARSRQRHHRTGRGDHPSAAGLPGIDAEWTTREVLGRIGARTPSCGQDFCLVSAVVVGRGYDRPITARADSLVEMDHHRTRRLLRRRARCGGVARYCEQRQRRAATPARRGGHACAGHVYASDRNGKSVAALGVKATDDVVVTTKSGMTVRMPVVEIRETGRGAQGVRVTKLDEGDKVVAAARVAAVRLPG